MVYSRYAFAVGPTQQLLTSSPSVNRLTLQFMHEGKNGKT